MSTRRVLVHAGFHKTGTASLQAQLRLLRDDLLPFFRHYGPEDMGDVPALATAFGRAPNDDSRRAFRQGFARFATQLPASGDIVISSEALSGALPGHRDGLGQVITGINPAARMLARDIKGILHRQLGDDIRLGFLYSTRRRLHWLRSTHGHQLRETALDLDIDAFAALFPKGFDLERDADSIANVLAPTPVHIRQLEEFDDDPQGPAAMVLDLMQVPDSVVDRLPPAARMNRGDSTALRQRFLNLNRQGHTSEKLQSLKEDARNLAIERGEEPGL